MAWTPTPASAALASPDLTASTKWMSALPGPARMELCVWTGWSPITVSAPMDTQGRSAKICWIFAVVLLARMEVVALNQAHLSAVSVFLDGQEVTVISHVSLVT